MSLTAQNRPCSPKGERQTSSHILRQSWGHEEGCIWLPFGCGVGQKLPAPGLPSWAYYFTLLCNLPLLSRGPWPVAPNSSLCFKGGAHEGVPSGLPASLVSRQPWSHRAEKLIMCSECFMVCYSSPANKKKITEMFSPSSPWTSDFKV